MKFCQGHCSLCSVCLRPPALFLTITFSELNRKALASVSQNLISLNGTVQAYEETEVLALKVM